jgi:hypothetical protein
LSGNICGIAFSAFLKNTAMKNKKKKQPDKPQPPSMEEQEKKREKTFPGYPSYPPEEDITKQGKEEDLDVEKITRSPRSHAPGKPKNSPPEREDDLDVPGTELDDENERIGEEDEENNFYSLGGERHEDLEEDNS